jgi:hypothetical protein
MTELNVCAAQPAESFLLGILLFKGLAARHVYKPFGIKGLTGVASVV